MYERPSNKHMWTYATSEIANVGYVRIRGLILGMILLYPGVKLLLS